MLICVLLAPGNFDMPEGIGRGAKRVLQGLLDRSVQDRWTVEMVDEVAWGIGWGDAGDEAPCPTEMLPPTRSRSRSRPASFPEHALADEHDSPQSPGVDKPSASRSRSGRSRSRLSAFHPYQHDQRFPTHHHDPPEPSLSGLHSSILRSVSTSSSSSNCLSSVGSPQSAAPSHSAERGRAYLGRNMASSSRSRSPPETPITPIDVSAALATRGRKASRAAVPSSPLESGCLAHLPETDAPIPEETTSFSRWVSSPDSEERRVTRSASRDNYSRTRPSILKSDVRSQAARAGSVPPHSLCSMPWSAQSFQLQDARILASTPGSVRGKTAASRSRSVGFDLIGASCSR